MSKEELFLIDLITALIKDIRDEDDYVARQATWKVLDENILLLKSKLESGVREK